MSGAGNGEESGTIDSKDASGGIVECSTGYVAIMRFGIGAGPIVVSEDNNGGVGGTVQCIIGHAALMVAIILASII